MKKFIKIFMVYSMLIPAVSLGKGGGNSAAQLDRYAPDPLSATYLIDGVAVPVVLKDSGEKVIAKGYATAKDEWRTNSFVPFDLEITFNVPTSGNRGTLILKKDNPTDLPEHDDELEVAVYFPNEDLLGANIEQKTTFNISKLDESGLYGPPDAKRALAYEFCIPDTVQNRTEVKRIDPTVKFFAQSPGRIGYKEHENLCIGSTHQKDFRGVLQRLVELTYVQRIDQSFFE